MRLRSWCSSEVTAGVEVAGKLAALNVLIAKEIVFEMSGSKPSVESSGVGERNSPTSTNLPATKLGRTSTLAQIIRKRFT